MVGEEGGSIAPWMTSDQHLDDGVQEGRDRLVLVGCQAGPRWDLGLIGPAMQGEWLGMPMR